MNLSDELRLFLRSRRERLAPADVGLPDRNGARRVRGLRREEVAQVAGISLDYYARLEQGRVKNVSDQVVDALASALRLDRVEHSHLRRLTQPRPRRETTPVAMPADIESMVLGLDPVPALLHTTMLDVVVVNRMADALLPGLADLPTASRNVARWTFLCEGSRRCMRDWAATARSMAASLRTATTEAPSAEGDALVAELLERSPDFRSFWSSHRLDMPAAFEKPFSNDAVGDLMLSYQSLAVPQLPGYFVAVYTAVPGSPSAAALAALASVVLTPSLRAAPG